MTWENKTVIDFGARQALSDLHFGTWDQTGRGPLELATTISFISNSVCSQVELARAKTIENAKPCVSFVHITENRSNDRRGSVHQCGRCTRVRRSDNHDDRCDLSVDDCYVFMFGPAHQCYG